MKYAADFRSIARNVLKGKWGIAVVAGLIASLLGAIGSSGPELNVELNDGNFNASLQILGSCFRHLCLPAIAMPWQRFANLAYAAGLFSPCRIENRWLSNN